MCGIALANYRTAAAGRWPSIASRSRDESSRDMTLAEAGAGEEIVMARFDLDALRAYREHETWGDAYRKPGAYAALVRHEVRAPFIREDARRW
jgi:predicted amidohydrolase